MESSNQISVSGLIMAGGAGERMKRSGGEFPKPLMRIKGVSLLERNVFALVKAGIKEIHVAASKSASDVISFTQSRCVQVAELFDAKLTIIEEQKPLGSIGAAAFLKDRNTVLVVNADNLTAIDLNAILESHWAADCALTLAVHEQPFPIPFGKVMIDGNRIVSYQEKPTLSVPVASAISVLGKAALNSLNPGENIGLPEFANRLLTSKLEINAYVHNAPWVDVNDVPTIKLAEELFSEHVDQFEC